MAATTVVYEGKPVGTPDAGAFWRVIASTRSPLCSPRRRPSAPSSKEDPTAKLLAEYDMSCLRTLFLAGERADPETR
jgi:propionyl-CoA synthetase